VVHHRRADLGGRWQGRSSLHGPARLTLYDGMESMADQAPPAAHLKAQRELAAALRGLIEAVVTTAAPVEVLGEVTAELGSLVRRLAKLPDGGQRAAGEAAPVPLVRRPRTENSPVNGPANPIAPPLVLS